MTLAVFRRMGLSDDHFSFPVAPRTRQNTALDALEFVFAGG
jgi:hypothetical protein